MTLFFNKNEIMKLFPAHTRGSADYGWLNSHFSFSFAGYYNPTRLGFGDLRVVNDDLVAPGQGFDTHPHKNMEIISIPLEGDLEHRDSQDNHQRIGVGEIQVMSAGTGIQHSEYNASNSERVAFLQIWIQTNRPDTAPRYDQTSIPTTEILNQFFKVVGSPDDNAPLFIYQNASIYLAKVDTDQKLNLPELKEGRGFFLFVIEGTAQIDAFTLSARDALEVTTPELFSVELSKNSYVLLIEVAL